MAELPLRKLLSARHLTYSSESGLACDCACVLCKVTLFLKRHGGASWSFKLWTFELNKAFATFAEQKATKVRTMTSVGSQRLLIGVQDLATVLTQPSPSGDVVALYDAGIVTVLAWLVASHIHHLFVV